MTIRVYASLSVVAFLAIFLSFIKAEIALKQTHYAVRYSDRQAEPALYLAGISGNEIDLRANNITLKIIYKVLLPIVAKAEKNVFSQHYKARNELKLQKQAEQFLTAITDSQKRVETPQSETYKLDGPHVLNCKVLARAY